MEKTSLELLSEQNQAEKVDLQNDFLIATAAWTHAKSQNPEERYTMLASAIAGHRVGIVRQSGKELPVYTDGSYIYLTKGRDDQRLEVMVQASILANGALNKATVRKLAARSRAARRYLFLEVHRAIHALRAELPRQLIDHPAFMTTESLSHSAEESLRLAFSPVHLPDPPEFFGTLRPIQVLKSALLSSESSRPTESDLQGDFEEIDLEELTDDDDAEEVKFLKLFENPLFSGGFISDILRNILGMGTAPGDEQEQDGAGGGAELPIARKESWLKRSMNALVSLIPVELPSGILAQEAGGKTYPEWDELNQSYRSDWTTVQEYDAWHADEKRDLTDIIEPPAPTLRRSLANIGLGHERHRHQPQGDHFNIDDLVRLLVDTRTGHIPDERIYTDTLKTRRDLGVLVLLDMSSSVSDMAAEGGCVFDQQAKAGYQIVNVLDELGDRVAFYSFYSWGRSLVRLLRIKSFEERLGSAVIDRMTHLLPMGYTRLGAAIRHAATIIEHSSGAPHRLLVIITDGFTYDEGYEGIYGEADAKRAIEEVRAFGIGVVCLNIGGTTEEQKLHNIFGASCHMSVSKPEHINTQLGDLFRNAIGEVMWKKHDSGTNVRVSSEYHS